MNNNDKPQDSLSIYAAIRNISHATELLKSVKTDEYESIIITLTDIKNSLIINLKTKTEPHEKV